MERLHVSSQISAGSCTAQTPHMHWPATFWIRRDATAGATEAGKLRSRSYLTPSGAFKKGAIPYMQLKRSFVFLSFSPMQCLDSCFAVQRRAKLHTYRQENSESRIHTGRHNSGSEPISRDLSSMHVHSWPIVAYLPAVLLKTPTTLLKYVMIMVYVPDLLYP